MADCTIGNSSNDSQISLYGDAFIGQEFVACESGKIDDLSFDLYSHNYRSLGTKVRIATGSTINWGGGTLLGTIDIEPVTRGVTETFKFIPTTSFEIVAGQTYIWWLEMDIEYNAPLLHTSQGRSSGGFEFLVNSSSIDDNLGPLQSGTLSVLRTGKGASGRMTQVLVHQLNIANINNNTPVPTMNEWGLLIFGLLILNLGVFFVVKTERHFE